VTIKLEVPPAGKPDTNQYFLAGELNKWNPGDTSFRFSTTGNQLMLKIPFTDSIGFQYKITRGSWSAGESDQDGFGAPNRTIEAYQDTVVIASVKGWTDFMVRKHTASANVMVLSDSFPDHSLHTYRKIWIYLPSSYTSSKKHYPVIYMQDGQNLFDRATSSFGTEWRVDETMDSLISRGKKEYIIVGIASGDARLHEYLPYESSQLPDPKGKEYSAFMVKDLVPYIDTHYRTLPGAANRSVAGSSMGAVISLFNIMEYPDFFGSAGLFSGAYWVISDADKKLVKETGKRKLDLFLYAGDAEMSSLVATTEKMKTALQKNAAIRVKTLYVKGGQHSEYYWQKPFLDFVLWIQQKK
jgi:predicted alpha/beta superfamily hydrolase